MKAKAQEILAKIAQFEEAYKKFVEMRLLDRETMGRIDLNKLQEHKIALERKIKQIEALKSEDAPPKPESVDYYSYDDPTLSKDQLAKLDRKVEEWQVLNQERRQYLTIIPETLNFLEKDVNNIIKPLTSIQQQFPQATTPEGAAKSQYEFLALSLTSDIQKYTPPENYKEDVVLQRSMEKLEAMQEGFIEKNRQIAKVVIKADKDDPSEKVRVYQGVNETLQFFKKSFKQIREEIDARVEKLRSIEINYEKAVERNNSLVETSKELLQSPRLKQVQNYPESSDSSFEAVLKDLQQLVKLPLAGAKKPTSFDAMVEPTDVYNSKATNVAFVFTALNEKIEAIESLVNKQIEKVESDIKKQEEAFQHHVTDITNQIREALLPASTKIASIEKKLEEALKQSNKKNMEPLAFAQAKLVALQKIAGELEEQVLIEQSLIRESYKQRINIIDADIKAKSKTTLEKVQEGNFQLSPADGRAVKEVKDYLTSLGGNVEGSIDGLKEVLKQASERKMEFDKSLDALEKIIDTHETAKDLVDRLTNDNITAPELVKAINESPHGSNLLKAMSQYPNKSFNEEQLIKILNDHFTEFNEKGKAAIKAFVAHRSVTSNDKFDLGKKVAFMEALEAKGIDANPFLAEDNANVINAALYLKSQNQTDFITAENLDNGAFCDAIAMLREQRIGLTEDMVSALASDPNKCAVVKQQIEQYQQHLDEYAGLKQEYLGDEHSIPVNRKPIEEKLFKALLVDFLKGEPEVAKAVNAVIEGKKANNMDQGTVRVCPPWLIVAVKEDKKLLEILSNEKNLEANMRFLGPVFDQSDVKNIYLENYLSSDPQMRLASQYPFIASKESSQGKLLAQLDKANSDELGPTFNLQKMGIVMQKINEFITDQEKETSDPTELKSLQDFRNEVAPVLLSNQKPSEKQKAIEDLAANRFKQTGFWARLAECIVEAFQSIMPAKVLSSAQQTFFSPKRVAAMETMRQMKQELADVKGEEETDEEALKNPIGGMSSQ